MPVAATFAFRDEDGDSLSDIARLDTMVTVVDAVNLLRDYSSTGLPARSRRDAGADDKRTLVELLVEQIEFADVVVINKIDRHRPATAATPFAASSGRSTPTRGSSKPISANAPLDAHPRHRPLRFEQAPRHPLWHKELYGFATMCRRPRNTASRVSSTARAGLSTREVPGFLARPGRA